MTENPFLAAPNSGEMAGVARARDSRSEMELHPSGQSLRPPRGSQPSREKEHIRIYDGLSTAAHDLKTPLAILAGYMELLLDQKLGPLNAAQREVLLEMKENEGRLQRFIKDFLTFNQFTDSSVQLTSRTADLNECIRELVSMWTRRFELKGVALFFAPSEELPQFPFDYYKVQHIVSNLLDNALKFSPRSTSVWIKTELHLWERRSLPVKPGPGVERRQQNSSVPNAARVSVSDAGPGIPPEFQQDIFQDFFRLESEGVSPGTGLGLAIARRLVSLHGGKIWVQSDSEVGSKFCFLLPLRPNV